MMSEVEVSFRDVTYAVPGGARVIDGLNLDVRRGETLVLLGESGCGKTTTLRLINRLLDPTGGSVTVGGRDTREWDPFELRRRTGYVIQEAGLFPHFTVERNVAVVPSLQGWDERKVRARASRSCSDSSGSTRRASATATRRSFRAGNVSASAWRAPSPQTRRCS
jgi:osmoprotectant transport system ATP-binding protein